MSNELKTTDTTALVGTADMLFNPAALDALERGAKMMSEARLTVPEHFRGKPGDCLAVLMQAAQWRMNPFSVAQKTHIVSGQLGYEAQLVNAVITSMAPTKDRLHFEHFGPWENVIGKFQEKTSQAGKKYVVPAWTQKDEQGCGVRVWATLKGEDEPRVLELLLSQATVRNSTLWGSDPKQQLAYLATKRWARLYTPDVIMGVYTQDELEQVDHVEKDMGTVEADKPAATESRAHSVLDKVKAKRKTEKAPIEGQAERIEPEPEPSAPWTRDSLLKAIQAAETPETLDELADVMRSIDKMSDGVRKMLTTAISDRFAALTDPSFPEMGGEGGGDE